MESLCARLLRDSHQGNSHQGPFRVSCPKALWASPGQVYPCVSQAQIPMGGGLLPGLQGTDPHPPTPWVSCALLLHSSLGGLGLATLAPCASVFPVVLAVACGRPHHSSMLSTPPTIAEADLLSTSDPFPGGRLPLHEEAEALLSSCPDLQAQDLSVLSPLGWVGAAGRLCPFATPSPSTHLPLESTRAHAFFSFLRSFPLGPDRGAESEL